MQTVFSLEFLVALFGASFQELLYWSGLKKKLSLKSVQAVYKSFGYWLITASVVVGSAFGVLIWSSGSAEYELKDFALMGAAFPALFKLGVNSLGGSDAPKLGNKSKSLSGIAKKYFFPERDHE